MTLDDILPEMDTKVVIGEHEFTRREIIERHQGEAGNKSARAYLCLAYSAKRAVDAGSDYPISDDQMAGIETAAILYNRLEQKHPLRERFPERVVRATLEAARKAYFHDKIIPYL